MGHNMRELGAVAAAFVKTPKGRIVDIAVIPGPAALQVWVFTDDAGDEPRLVQELHIPWHALDAVLDEGEVEDCDECGFSIPQVDGGGLANRHHAESCSLHDPNAE